MRSTWHKSCQDYIQTLFQKLFETEIKKDFVTRSAEVTLASKFPEWVEQWESNKKTDMDWFEFVKGRRRERGGKLSINLY